MTAERVASIRQRLEAALEPISVEIVDDSHRHAGHVGARDGRGHFRVRVVSTRFEGRRPIARHQLIYEALGDLMRTDIHALSITALTPVEAAER
ncbi:MAG TPA: BolA family protein [Steroidobacteraceae bacterium]|nr:BolA family protein [Steroidobacteraceae bacterium]